MRVYVLHHVHTFASGSEDVKLIGVYSSNENARTAIKRLSQMLGFSEAPDGFHIDEYQLDKDHWAEGYMTIEDEKKHTRRKEDEKRISEKMGSG